MLSLFVIAPLAALGLCLFLPARTLRWLALGSALVGCGLSVAAWPTVSAARGFVLEVRAPWSPTLGASWHLGMDGYSLLLVLLSNVLFVVAVLASWDTITERVREYHAWLLLLQAAVNGVFLALDFLLFFTFFELALIPMYFVVLVWGGPRRQYAATKFLIYTLLGSVLILVAGLALNVQHERQFGAPSFAYADWARLTLAPGLQWWVFVGLLAGFAIKIPMVPLHTWLPDAHTEAPTAGSVLLAGVLLKLGTYGLARWTFPLLPTAARDPGLVTLGGVLSLVAIVYGALVSLRQEDWKRLVAYSSVSHMGFCTLGLFALNREGVLGSLLQQVNHGLSSALLFLLVGMMQHRRNTRVIEEFGGLLRQAPAYSWVLLVAVLSAMGFPPLNGFWGEVAVLRGALGMSWVWAAWCGLGIVLGVAYLLWLYQRVALRDATGETVADLTLLEKLSVLPLLAGILAISFLPGVFFTLLEPAAAAVLGRPR